MRFLSYVPRAPLCEFVNDFWLYENYEPAHQRELILPSGTFEMVFNLQEDELRIYNRAQPEQCHRFAGALVSGPYSRPFMSDAAEERAILGVHFKPGGAFAILGMPANELEDAHIDLRAIWGSTAETLHSQLCAVEEPSARFRLLEQALMRRLIVHPSGHGAVAAALDVLVRTHGKAKTRDLAMMVGLSQRRLIELFATEVGLKPKLFGRIRRFLHAMERVDAEPSTGWAELAIESGYFDQAHLTRDFDAFAGVSPADYRRRQEQLARVGVHTTRLHLPWAA
jgi:AraC-like DNA-binding protein